MSEQIKLKRHGEVAIVSLNRPDKKNALNFQMRTHLADMLSEVSQDERSKVVVLRGEGDAFCVGADLIELAPVGQTIEQQLEREYKPILMRILTMSKPVIAEVNGAAAGIGLSLALACDLVVMGESAYMLSPFCAVGLIPDGGATWLLTRALGHQRAYAASIENQKLSAEFCLTNGLANKVVPDLEVQATTRQWARDIAKRAPISLALTKKAMRYAASAQYKQSFKLEAELQQICGRSQDHKEGVIAFRERRPPTFTGS